MGVEWEWCFDGLHQGEVMISGIGDDVSREELRHLLAGMCYDTKKFAYTLLKGRFFRNPAPFHDEIFRLIDDPSIRQIAIAAPRSTGKTSIVSLALPARHILFRHSRFIVMISATEDSALMQSVNLKSRLTGNQLIRGLFGDVRPRNRDSDFAKGVWEAHGGEGLEPVVVMARGAGQQTRGMIRGDARPDLILIDDLEDPSKQITDEAREKIERWFWDDIYFLPDRGSDNFKIILLGTVTHPNCLLQKLLDNPAWHGVRLELFDDSRRSLWPEYKTDEEIAEIYSEFEKEGKLDLLYMNWRNIPVARETATFKPEYFKYYDEKEVAGKITESAVLVDPAKTFRETSAETAIGVVGFSCTGNIYVRDVVSGKFPPERIYEIVFELADRYGCRVIGIEETSLHAFITYPIKDAALRRGKYYEFVSLKPWASKEERVGSLESFYRRGLIWHNRTATAKLESQLLAFPRPKMWDCADMMAYTIQLMHLGERYGSAFFRDEMERTMEEEMKRLDEMDMAVMKEYDWRKI